MWEAVSPDHHELASLFNGHTRSSHTLTLSFSERAAHRAPTFLPISPNAMPGLSLFTAGRTIVQAL